MLLGVYPQFQVVRAPAEVKSVPGIVIEIDPGVEHLMISQWMKQLKSHGNSCISKALLIDIVELINDSEMKTFLIEYTVNKIH